MMSDLLGGKFVLSRGGGEMDKNGTRETKIYGRLQSVVVNYWTSLEFLVAFGV